MKDCSSKSRFRCKEDETYEWFKGYEYFSEAILPFLKKSDKILMLGCGNSSKHLKYEFQFSNNSKIFNL